MLFTATELKVYQISENTPASGTRVLSVGNLCRFEAVFDTDVVQNPLDPPPAGEVFINFGLFLPIGFSGESVYGPAGNYYYRKATGSALGANYSMDYVGQQEANNGEFAIKFSENSGFLRITVLGTFILLEDADNYLSSLRNARRLLFNSINSGTVLDNSAVSVYNGNRLNRLALYYKEPPTPPSTIPVFSLGLAEEIETHRWYNADTFDNPATLVINPRFELRRNNVLVDSISAFEDTELTFECNTTQASPHVLVWIFKEDAPNGLKLLVANKADIATVPNQVLSVKLPEPYGTFTNYEGTETLFSPSSTLFNVSGDKWRTIFRIKASALDVGARYRVIVVVNYLQASNYLSSYSFISKSYLTDTPPPLTPPVITGSLNDYVSEYGNALECAPYERIESNLTVEYGAYDTKRLGMGTWYGNLMRIEVTLFYLESIYRQIVERHAFTKKSDYTWNNNGKGEITIDPFSYKMRMKYPFRVRQEPATANVATLVETSGTPVAPANGVQDWTGKDIYIEYKFILGYQSPIVFEDILYFTQILRVKSLDETTLEIELQDKDGNPLRIFCDGETDCYVKVKDLLSLNDAGFISILDKELFSINNVKEFESLTGILTRLQDSPLVSADGQFDNATHIAKAKILASGLPTETRFRVGAIRKQQGFTVKLVPGCNTNTACPWNGQIIAQVSGGTPPYTYKTDDLLGQDAFFMGTLEPNRTFNMVVTDSTGRKIRASAEVCNNAVLAPIEPFGNCLFFIPQYTDTENYRQNNELYIPPASAYNFGNNAFSVSVWMKLAAHKGLTGEEHFLVSALDFLTPPPVGCSTLQGWSLILKKVSGDLFTLIFEIRTGPLTSMRIASAARVIVRGQWYHFVAVRNPGTIASTWKLYMNGCNVFSSTIDNTGNAGNDVIVLSSGFPIRAGNSNRGIASECAPSALNTSFWGMLDEILLYNKALTASEVFGLYNYGLGGIPPAGNLQGRWRLNESGVDSGGLYASANGSEGRIVAPDLSPNNNPGQLHNFGIRTRATFPIGELGAWISH